MAATYAVDYDDAYCRYQDTRIRGRSPTGDRAPPAFSHQTCSPSRKPGLFTVLAHCNGTTAPRIRSGSFHGPDHGVRLCARRCVPARATTGGGSRKMVPCFPKGCDRRPDRGVWLPGRAHGIALGPPFIRAPMPGLAAGALGRDRAGPVHLRRAPDPPPHRRPLRIRPSLVRRNVSAKCRTPRAGKGEPDPGRARRSCAVRRRFRRQI